MMKIEISKTKIILVSIAAFAGASFLIWHNRNFIYDVFFFDPPFEPAKFEVVIPENICNIKDYGAVPDGETKNTEFITEAIEDCSVKSGGKVVIPEGAWLTGKIHLKSNVELHLEKGAEIIFSDDPEDYLPVVFTRFEGMELYNYSPFIYCADCENVAITGAGKLNGKGEKWSRWNDKQDEAVNKLYGMAMDNVPVSGRVFGTEKDALRPSMVQFVNSKNILIEDVTVADSPMWTIHPVYSENIRIKNIRVDTSRYNTDGIVVDSSRNVLIEDSFLETGDDAIAIKSGLDEEGWRIGRPSENIIIKRCEVRRGHGAVAIGSEVSGGVKNVHVWNNDFSNVDYGIRIKSAPGRGGRVEEVRVDNLRMHDIDTAIIADMEYPSFTIAPETETPSVFESFSFTDISGRDIKNVVILNGAGRPYLSGVSFRNLDFSSVGGIIMEDAENIMFNRVKIAAEKKKGKSPYGPLYTLVDMGRVTIKNSNCPAEFSRCVKEEKTDRSDIIFENNRPRDRWDQFLN